MNTSEYTVHHRDDHARPNALKPALNRECEPNLCKPHTKLTPHTGQIIQYHGTGYCTAQYAQERLAAGDLDT